MRSPSPPPASWGPPGARVGVWWGAAGLGNGQSAAGAHGNRTCSHRWLQNRKKQGSYCNEFPTITKQFLHPRGLRKSTNKNISTKTLLFFLLMSTCAKFVNVQKLCFECTMYYTVLLPSHYFVLKISKKLIFYIALYCVLLYTQITLQSGGGGVSPQPPPVCSIHMDDATTATKTAPVRSPRTSYR